MAECDPCRCGGMGSQHNEGCPVDLGRRAADSFRLELESRAEARIREIVREELDLFLERSQRDTVPVPPACATCYMAACICYLVPDETGGEGGP